MAVGEALNLWVEAEAASACERSRGDELAGLIRDFNERWAAWVAENFPGND